MYSAEEQYYRLRAIGIINGFFIKPLLKKGYAFDIKQNVNSIEVSFNSKKEPINGLKYDYLTGELTLSLKESKVKNKPKALPKNLIFTKTLNNGITVLSIDCKKQCANAFINAVKHIVNHF